MGIGRRSFLRTATVVGTIGAAGSAESWAKEIKEQQTPKPKPYKGYEEDLLQLTLEIEKKFNTESHDWPEPPSQERPYHTYGKEMPPEWAAYDEAIDKARVRRCEVTCIWETIGCIAPVGSRIIADAMGYLEQEEAKPILIVSAPQDFSDFRNMAGESEVDMVYDEGPIRCRIFTVPVVTSTKIGQGNILVAGIKKDGTLRMTGLTIAR